MQFSPLDRLDGGADRAARSIVEAHIHLSLLGPALPARLITQMYFEGDPLLVLDPIYNSVPPDARHRLVAPYAHDVTEENFAQGYRFDIVLNGPDATPPDPHNHE